MGNLDLSGLGDVKKTKGTPFFEAGLYRVAVSRLYVRPSARNKNKLQIWFEVAVAKSNRPDVAVGSSRAAMRKVEETEDGTEWWKLDLSEFIVSCCQTKGMSEEDARKWMNSGDNADKCLAGDGTYLAGTLLDVEVVGVTDSDGSPRCGKNGKQFTNVTWSPAGTHADAVFETAPPAPAPQPAQAPAEDNPFELQT